LLSMLADIESSRIPVMTICVGKAMSAGAILLAFGEPGARFADPNATIMLHEVSGAHWFTKLTDLKVDVSELGRLNQLVFQKMAHNCGHKDLNYFLKLIEKKHNIDLYLNPFEAKKHGIIDLYGTPEFLVKITKDIEIVYNKPQTSSPRKHKASGKKRFKKEKKPRGKGK
jgi:ATP-dependent protease ClpP protease subunit